MFLGHVPLDPENFCAVPLIPKNVYHCSPNLFACYTSLFIVEKISFKPPLSSPWNALMLFFIDCRFCHFKWLSWWSTSRRRLGSSSSSSEVSSRCYSRLEHKQCCSHRHFTWTALGWKDLLFMPTLTFSCRQAIINNWRVSLESALTQTIWFSL